MITENGRQVSFEEIRKRYGGPTRTRAKAVIKGMEQIDVSELQDIVNEHKSTMRKSASVTPMHNKILAATRPERIGMQANGISRASLRLVKIAHANGTRYDENMFTKLSLPEQSANAIGTDASPFRAGATNRGISDGFDDGTTRPQLFGAVATNVNSARSIDAIRQCLEQPTQMWGA